MPVLITGAATAGAYRLQQSLNLSDVAFADHHSLPVFAFRGASFIQIPEGHSLSFAHQLLTICLDHSIDMVFPLRRSEMEPLTSAKKLFQEYGIEIIVPDFADLNRLLQRASAAGGEIVVIKDGMVLSGQLLEEGEIPALTGVFACPVDNYSELTLFIVD